MWHHPIIYAVVGALGTVFAVTDLNGVAAVIGSVATPIVTVGVVLITQRRGAAKVDAVAAKVDAVHQEVRTMNEGTLGSFAAEDETRRIEQIPHDARTATEQRHIDQAPEPEPPIGPPR